jgi:transcriptional regulator with XRE-family HTH domain
MTTRELEPADIIDTAVGARLKVQRRRLGMSQALLAEGLGISFQQVQKYESGANRISASMLLKAARVLECSAATLLGDEQEDAAQWPLLAQLTVTGAVELLEAYVAIPDPDQRAAVLTIAKGMAGAPARRPQRSGRA